MLCLYCKNEKLDELVCPHCGLEEKQAFLKAAGLYEAEGKWELAADYYGRFLALEPGDFDAARKRALLSSTMARNWRDPLWFKEAEGQLARILEDHWDWEAGHQNRVDLFYCFGNLDSLQKEYETIREKNPARAEVCGQTIQWIQLVQRFRDEKPKTSGNPKTEDESALVWKSFWPLLLGLAVALVITLVLPSSVTSETGAITDKFSFMTQLVTGIAILGLGFFGIWRYLQGRKAVNPPVKKTKSLDGMPPDQF